MRIARLVFGIWLVVMLAGCTSPADDGLLWLSADEQLEPCSTIAVIAVEELSGTTPVCEPVGSTLRFPDGFELIIEPGGGGASATIGDRTYGYTSVGKYGTAAAAYVNDCEQFESWGQPEAIEKVAGVWGEFLGHC